MNKMGMLLCGATMTFAAVGCATASLADGYPSRNVPTAKRAPKSVVRTRVKIVERPIYIDRPVDRIVEKRVEVPVVKIVEKPVDRPVYVDRPVDRIVEKRVEVPVDRPIYVDRPVDRVIERRVEVPVDRPVYVDRPVDRIVEKRVEVPVDRPIYVDRPVDRIIERRIEVPVDRPVYVDRPVERVVERRVDVPVDRIVRVPVYIEQQERRFERCGCEADRRADEARDYREQGYGGHGFLERDFERTEESYESHSSRYGEEGQAWSSTGSYQVGGRYTQSLQGVARSYHGSSSARYGPGGGWIGGQTYNRSGYAHGWSGVDAAASASASSRQRVSRGGGYGGEPMGDNGCCGR